MKYFLILLILFVIGCTSNQKTEVKDKTETNNVDKKVNK